MRPLKMLSEFNERHSWVGVRVGVRGDVQGIRTGRPSVSAQEFPGFVREPTRGLEPLTYGLQNRCSAIELHRRMGARVRVGTCSIAPLRSGRQVTCNRPLTAPR